MSEWKQKRFWSDAAAVEAEGGFAIHLDGRAVKTPAKTSLVVPALALAQGIADEWCAQEEVVDPLSMPLTRSANAAIDKVAAQFDEVAELIAAYGESDLICYRAPDPAGLVARQSEAWDPLMTWSADTLSAPLNAGAGVMHLAQPEASVAVLAERVRGLDPFALTALHDLVSLSGSLVIGFAALEDAWPIETLWTASRIDEQWQTDQWGEDEEAERFASERAQGFKTAHRFYRLSRS